MAVVKSRGETICTVGLAAGGAADGPWRGTTSRASDADGAAVSGSAGVTLAAAGLGTYLYLSFVVEIVRRDDIALLGKLRQVQLLLGRPGAADLLHTQPDLFRDTMSGQENSLVRFVAPDGTGGAGVIGRGSSAANAVDQRQQRLRTLDGAHRQEHPAAFLAPLDDTGVGKNANVARDAGLALVEQIGKFAHRQLHPRQQSQDAQPRRIGKCLKKVGKRERIHGPEMAYKENFISSNPQ